MGEHRLHASQTTRAETVLGPLAVYERLHSVAETETDRQNFRQQVGHTDARDWAGPGGGKALAEGVGAVYVCLLTCDD